MVEKLPLVVSMGEPAGIGPEIILKAYLQAVDEGLPFFYVYGDAALLRISAEQLGLDISVIDIETAEEATATFASGLPVISVADYIPFSRETYLPAPQGWLLRPSGGLLKIYMPAPRVVW